MSRAGGEGRVGRMGTLAAAALLAGVGVAMRLSNARFYPTNWGFDAKFNWEYIAALRESWALRAPDTLWATSHPPLYYYLASAIDSLAGQPAIPSAVTWIRLAGVAAGLLTVALAVRLVQRIDPGNSRRALFAAALLLFLPAHVYMSAMLNEEIVVAAFTSVAIFVTAGVVLDPAAPRKELWRAAAIGVAAGLAWLTKLTGVLAVAAAVLTYVWLGWRRDGWKNAAARIAVLSLAALATGGWYYLHNLWVYGYLYPFGLPAHELMFQMPPGSRGVLDYVYVPVATWTDPQLLSPDLLHSVWGSTYASVWYDGHRFFLPRSGAGQQVWGTRLMVLALLPTAAFVAGGLRSAFRLARDVRGRITAHGASDGALGGEAAAAADVPLLALTALTLAGYVLFTFRNPWFASVKGSYLLGLSLPFACWASDALDRWSRGHWSRSVAVWTGMGLLIASVAFVFTWGLILKKAEVPGLAWSPVMP
ncbi:MAG: glycosyltransferase family 39 protein [Deltaproteobacteria bacterium]|nr:glycosyltransferase family 39 protein [Deltaproteobacteria bacterium]